MAKYYFLLSFIVFACLFQEGNSCFIFPRVHVSIVNELPPKSEQFFLHCKSKDDDLGNHTVPVNQDFHFDFCVIPWATLFYCNLSWGKRAASFEVYNGRWISVPCQTGKSCVYEVRDDGIYLGDKFWNNWYCGDEVC
ncbi:hypothetical protein ABFS82_06G167100 [Erythranthe guttata]